MLPVWRLQINLQPFNITTFQPVNYAST